MGVNWKDLPPGVKAKVRKPTRKPYRPGQELNKATIVNITETEVQVAIKSALTLAHFGVLETTAWKQKEKSGVDKGVPDLLVYHPACKGQFLPLEVKKPGAVKYSSPEQEQLHKEGYTYVVQSSEEALAIAIEWIMELRPRTCAWREFEQLERKARAVLNGLRIQG